MRPSHLAFVAALLVSCSAPYSAPSPSVAPPTASSSVPASVSSAPTAAPSPTAADPSMYGVLLQAPGRIFVRRERSLSDVILAIGGEQPAASHDGRRVAFWRTAPQGNNPQEL